MRKLKVKTAKESPGLIKVDSNPALTSQFPGDVILEIIERAKKLELEKGKGVEGLRQIVKNYSNEKYPTKPSNFSFDISDTGEKAYQRAIFLSEKTKLNTIGEVIWNDLELPVVFNKNPRRPSVDLVGTLDNNTSVLCELKFVSQKGDSPIYAAIELLIYYYLIQDNSKALDNQKVFHKNEQVKRFNWRDFNHNSLFIVGANKTYWDFWQKQYEERKKEFRLWCSSLPLKIRFFSSDNFDFKKQKGTNKKYTPTVSDKIQWTEIYL